LGNRHEARKAFGRVAGRGAEVLGPDHWAVARARAYFGEEPQTERIEVPQLPAPVQEPPYQQQPPTTHFPGVQQPTYGAPAAEPNQPYGTPTAASNQTYGTPTAPPNQTYAVSGVPFDARAGDDAALPLPVRVVPPSLSPPPPVQHILSAPASAPVRHEPELSAYGRRAPALFAAIAAILAAIIAVIALVVVLAQRGDNDDNSDVPTLGGGPAPTDVRLRDKGSSVQLTWSDPANGTTSFIISGGHPGEVLKPMGQVSPGQTAFGLNGLNPDLDYCFAVVAVYSTKDFSSSPQACTSRAKASARPSTTQ